MLFLQFVGYLVYCERFARISTGVKSYGRRWPLTHNFQPFNRMSQSVQNTTSSSAVAEESEKLSVLQRFKRTYKKHGKILVGVHIVTSLVWYGSFYLTLSRWVWLNYQYSVENVYSIRYDLDQIVYACDGSSCMSLNYVLPVWSRVYVECNGSNQKPLTWKDDLIWTPKMIFNFLYQNLQVW